MINVIGWFILVLMFAILRRTAGNYGRLAVIRKEDDESKWTQLFFQSQTELEESEATSGDGPIEEADSLERGQFFIQRCSLLWWKPSSLPEGTKS